MGIQKNKYIETDILLNQSEIGEQTNLLLGDDGNIYLKQGDDKIILDPESAIYTAKFINTHLNQQSTPAKEDLKLQLKAAKEDVKNLGIWVKIDASKDKLKSLSIGDLIALYNHAKQQKEHFKLMQPKDISMRYEIMEGVIEKFIYEYMEDNLPEL